MQSLGARNAPAGGLLSFTQNASKHASGRRWQANRGGNYPRTGDDDYLATPGSQ